MFTDTGTFTGTPVKPGELPLVIVDNVNLSQTIVREGFHAPKSNLEQYCI